MPEDEEEEVTTTDEEQAPEAEVKVDSDEVEELDQEFDMFDDAFTEELNDADEFEDEDEDENEDEDSDKDSDTKETETEADAVTTEDDSDESTTEDSSEESEKETEEESKPEPTPVVVDPRDGQIAALLDVVKQQQVTQTATVTPETESETPTEPKRIFQMNVPDEIIEHIMSGEADHVKAGLTTLVNGVAEVVRRQVMEEHKTLMDEGLHQYTVDRDMAKTQQTEIDGAVAEYFKEYPGHVGKEKIVQVALMDLMEKDPSIKEWTSDVRVRLSQQVAEWTGNDGKGAAPKPISDEASETVKTPEKKPSRKRNKTNRPPRMTRPGSRASSTSTKSTESIGDEIDELANLDQFG